MSAADPASLPPSHARSAAQIDALLDRAWDERLSDARAALVLCDEAYERAQALAYKGRGAQSLRQMLGGDAALKAAGRT